MNILPCPFCGGKPKFTRHKDSPPEILKPYWQLGCPGKKCILNPLAFGDTKQKAVADWNYRQDVYTPGMIAAVDLLLREQETEVARRLLRSWGINLTGNDAAWTDHLLEEGSIREETVQFIRSQGEEAA